LEYVRGASHRSDIGNAKPFGLPLGSHIPWLDVGKSAAPPDVDDHLAPEGSTVLVLPAGVLRVLINAETVHASKQQSRKTGLLKAVAVDPSFFGHLESTGGKSVFATGQGEQEAL